MSLKFLAHLYLKWVSGDGKNIVHGNVLWVGKYIGPKLVQRAYELINAYSMSVYSLYAWTKLNETLTHETNDHKLDFMLISFFLKLIFKGIFPKLIHIWLFSQLLYGRKNSSVVEHFAPMRKVVGSNPQHFLTFFIIFLSFFDFLNRYYFTKLHQDSYNTWFIWITTFFIDFY